MFRGTSETAVDTRARSVAGKPHHPANSRPFWRAATISVSESMDTRVSLSMSAAFMRRSFPCGAEGGTRTPTGCPTRPSNVRVCQFRHFGSRTKTKYTVSAERRQSRRSSAPSPHRLPEPRVERVANSLAQQVVREHRDQDREAGIERQPPPDLDRVLALVQDVAPGRVRGLHAEPEELEPRLRE